MIPSKIYTIIFREFLMGFLQEFLLGISEFIHPTILSGIHPEISPAFFPGTSPCILSGFFFGELLLLSFKNFDLGSSCYPVFHAGILYEIPPVDPKLFIKLIF